MEAGLKVRELKSLGCFALEATEGNEAQQGASSDQTIGRRLGDRVVGNALKGDQDIAEVSVDVGVPGVFEGNDQRSNTIYHGILVLGVNRGVGTSKLVGCTKGKPSAAGIPRITHAIKEKVQFCTSAVGDRGRGVINQIRGRGNTCEITVKVNDKRVVDRRTAQGSRRGIYDVAEIVFPSCRLTEEQYGHISSEWIESDARRADDKASRESYRAIAIDVNALGSKARSLCARERSEEVVEPVAACADP